MPRDPFTSDPRDPEDPSARSGSRRRTHRLLSLDSDALRVQENHPTHPPADIPHRVHARGAARTVSLGDRNYFLLESELHTLTEVGSFRAVAISDLARFAYGGDTARIEREIHHLKSLSLLAERKILVRRDQTVRLVALTRKGARLLRASGHSGSSQTIHYGFVKPREAKHDADLYRLYQAGVTRIAADGGRPTRVLLDFELKRNLNRDLAAIPKEQLTDELRERIAVRHGLTVIDGKIPLPDLRVEYQTAELETRRLDLELATRNYRPRALSQKAKAGFSLYALREDASRLRRVLDEREITAEIFAL
jgi:hypothetical protein